MGNLNQIATITLEEMDFYAFHGCYKEERAVGARFIVNITITANISVAAKTDRVTDAIDYVKVYEIVKKEMSEPSNLLENLSTRVIDSLYSNFPEIIHAIVKVSKINPPVGGGMKCVSLTISR